MVFASGDTTENPPKTPFGLCAQKWEMCTTAHSTQAVRGLPENKQNSDNRRKVFLLELKCPFAWELSSFKKETRAHDSSLDGRPLPGAQ